MVSLEILKQLFVSTRKSQCQPRYSRHTFGVEVFRNRALVGGMVVNAEGSLNRKLGEDVVKFPGHNMLFAISYLS